MGRLAEIAGTKALTGPVSFTDAGGITHQCADEAAAEAVTAGKAVFHHRGAFFEEGCEMRGYTPKAEQALSPEEDYEPAAPAPSAPKMGKKKKKARRSSED